MAYFDMFPEIDYNSKGDGKTTALKNLLTRVKVVAKVEEDIFNFDYNWITWIFWFWCILVL